ncbi:ABC transporter permease subunit [Erysipelotrichaceae bacterium OttesenSCG-928-M19]|nr:ABC transporter permease subunit [Erysipelotrichaceae bacterium OttesenSCG-928-M19]
MKKKLKYYFCGLLITHLLWWVFSITLNNSALVNPLTVYQNIFFSFDSTLVIHTFESLKRVFISLAISLSLGIIVALLMDEFTLLNKLLNPIIYLLYPIPKPALLAIIMSLQGIGNASKITIIVLITFFQIVIYLNSNLAQISSNTKYPLLSLGASRLQIVSQLKIPAIIPGIIASLKITLASAFAILFLIENYGTTYGLGYYIQNAWTKMDYVDMYTGVIFISFTCLILFVFIEYLEQELQKKGYIN